MTDLIQLFAVAVVVLLVFVAGVVFGWRMAERAMFETVEELEKEAEE